MSNDNKTLADVQPGGMVRLGDQAERARFEAWAEERELGTAKCSADGMKGDYADLNTDWCWAAWRAALSAQPSPGDQGDARAQFEAWAESEGYHVERRQRGNVGDYSRAEVSELWGMWQLNPQQLLDAAKRKATSYGRASVQDGASCAGASQAGHGGHVRDARKALHEVLAVMSAKAALAARQPVGEPVAWMTHHDEPMLFPTAAEAAAYCEDDEQPVPLFRSPAQAVDLGPTFQAGVAEWMGQCFLPSLYSNMTERGDRLLEEVLELLQANGYDSARVPTLVNYVFGRPVGVPAQEVGGVMVTLAGYCWVAGLDMHAAGHAELARINQPDVMAKIRAKQEAKNALHFDTPLPGDPAATEDWPREGDLVRYGDGSSALAIRLEPHAGGWHGYQCCGGYTFFTKAYRPSRADMDTWLDCAKYRDERTKVADNRIAHQMYLLDSQAVGNG